MTDQQIVQAMIDYGGSFVAMLGRAWQIADGVNQQRIKAAFPDYWATYAKVGNGRKAREKREVIRSVQRSTGAQRGGELRRHRDARVP